jgi:DNA-binding Lrp family transcriptional regulator
VNAILDEINRKLLSEMVNGLPFVSEPFKDIANRLGITPEEIFSRLTKLRENGVIRRFGPSIKPNNVGLSANALVAWKVPEIRVQEIGAFLSKFKEVTHCYERETIPGKWEYNLYIVLHAQERETIEQLTKKFSDAIGVNDYLILYSTRELKKNGFTANGIQHSYAPNKSNENPQELRNHNRHF